MDQANVLPVRPENATAPLVARVPSRYDPRALSSLDAFLSLDVRIGTIISAERLQGARRACLGLRVDLGEQGAKGGAVEITDLYDPDDLVGLQVVAVLGVPPRRVAGFDSEVLILSVGNGRGENTLLIPERPVPDGARVGEGE
jgi:tRNA-binding protein